MTRLRITRYQPTNQVVRTVPDQISAQSGVVDQDTGRMGLAYNTYLNSNKIYGCKNCKAHLSNHEDIISRVCCAFLAVAFRWKRPPRSSSGGKQG
jgi:hypothetical protein